MSALGVAGVGFVSAQRRSNWLMQEQIRMEREILLLPHLQTFLERYHNPGITMILVLVSLAVKESD